jgi:hypothetical protein
MSTPRKTRHHRRYSRRLRFEPLESRLALTGLSAAAVSLADYLAQPQEMGPALEQAVLTADAPSAPAPAESALTHEVIAEQLAASLAPSIDASEAEGEGFPDATLDSFTVQHVDGGWVRLSGSLSSSNPLGVPVFFGGLFSGLFTLSDSLGNFSRTVPDPGYAGFVSAQAPYSNIMWAYLA